MPEPRNQHSAESRPIAHLHHKSTIALTSCNTTSAPALLKSAAKEDAHLAARQAQAHTGQSRKSGSAERTHAMPAVAALEAAAAVQVGPLDIHQAQDDEGPPSTEASRPRSV